MKNLKLVPTDQNIISQNYPYGFRLKTTKKDYLEFNPKFGFRHCYTTINPKTGRENTPKKSTYYKIMLLGTNEDNHCKSIVFDINGLAEIQKAIDFLKDTANFDLFSNEQMHYIYLAMLSACKIDMYARKVYAGQDVEIMKPFYLDNVALLARGLKNNGMLNTFEGIKFDVAGLDALKDPNFSPFKITHYSEGLSKFPIEQKQ